MAVDSRLRLSASALVEWAERRRFSHPNLNASHDDEPYMAWARIVSDLSGGRIDDAQLYRARQAGMVLLATAERWAALLGQHPYSIWGGEWMEATVEAVRRIEEDEKRRFLLSDATPFRPATSHRRREKVAA